MQAKTRPLVVIVAIVASAVLVVAAAHIIINSSAKPTVHTKQSPSATVSASVSTPPGIPFAKATALPNWSTDYAMYVPRALGFILSVAGDKLGVGVPQDQWRIATYTAGQEPKDRVSCGTFAEIDVSNGQFPYVVYCDGKFLYFEAAYTQSPPTQEMLLTSLVTWAAIAMNGNGTSTSRSACYAGALTAQLETSTSLTPVVESLLRYFQGAQRTAYSNGRAQGITVCA